jgi:hypothetical protein
MIVSSNITVVGGCGLSINLAGNFEIIKGYINVSLMVACYETICLTYDLFN